MDKNTTDKISVGNSTMPRAEQGWECPRCGHINAPWVRQCDCSRSNYTITSDLTYKPERWEANYNITEIQSKIDPNVTAWNCTNPNNCHTPHYTTETAINKTSKETIMRDPKRIPEFCNKLAEIWSKYPDFRFGQFMINVFSAVPGGIWYCEDDKMIKFIEDYMRSILGEKYNDNP